MLNFIHSLKQHPFFSKAIRPIAVPIALVLAGVLYVAFVGIFFDASGLRDETAAKLTENLGRDVRFDGSLQIEVSAHPKLIVAGLHIANAAGFVGNDFASLGEVRLVLDLWPLLRFLRLQIEELSGSNVLIRLQQNSEGDGNWSFAPAGGHKDIAPSPSAKKAVNTELKKLLTRLDIKRVSLENLDVEYIGANSKSHFFELQSLVAQFPAGQPVTLSLHGAVEKKYPYHLDFNGGTIADLTHVDKPWPVDLKLGFMSSRLSLNGNMTGSTGALDFSLGTENLSEFERLFQTKLPAVGVARISGAIKYSPGEFAMGNLAGVMGNTTLYGFLNFNDNGNRPKIQGELTLPVLLSQSPRCLSKK